MHRSRLLALPFAFLFALGCATPIRVDSEFDRSADFSRLRSYAYLVRPDSAPLDERIDAELLTARVQRAADRALGARGYVKDIHANPDFLIAYHALLGTRIDVSRIINLEAFTYRSWAQPLRTEQIISEYEEGTIILDIIDARSRQLLWRGYGQTRVDLDGTSRERAQRLREVITEILASFPPT